MTQPSLKVALITGCSSGVGLYTAVLLAKAGVRVYATMRERQPPKKDFTIALNC